MTIRSFFVASTLISSVVFSAISLAAEHQDIDKLRNNVKQFVKAHFLNLNSQLKEDQNLFIEVGNLDSRLKLQPCDKDLTLKLSMPPHQTNHGTVKTSCEGARRWTIYIPVTIDIFKSVVVAARDLPRGSVVTEADLSVMNLSTSNFGMGLALAADVDSLYGLELKRPLRAGSPVNTKFLKKPNIIAKGDSVTLQSASKSLSVSVSGVALDDGHLGKRIRVRNRQSQRVVDALVVAPGKVSIAAH